MSGEAPPAPGIDIVKGLKGLNLPRYCIIEFPGTIRNFDAATEMYGGTDKICNTLNKYQEFINVQKEQSKSSNQKKSKSKSSTNKKKREPFLELNLNPNGVFDHPLHGKFIPFTEEYLLIKIPKIGKPTEPIRSTESTKSKRSNHPKSEMDDDSDDNSNDNSPNTSSPDTSMTPTNAIINTVPIEIMGWLPTLVCYEDLCDFQVFSELKYPQKVTQSMSPIRGPGPGSEENPTTNSGENVRRNVIRKRRRGQRVWSLRDDDIPNISKYPLVPLVFSAKTEPVKDFLKSSKKKRKKKSLTTAVKTVRFDIKTIPHLPHRKSIWMEYHKNLTEYMKEGNEHHRDIPGDKSDNEVNEVGVDNDDSELSEDLNLNVLDQTMSSINQSDADTQATDSKKTKESSKRRRRRRRRKSSKTSKTSDSDESDEETESSKASKSRKSSHSRSPSKSPRKSRKKPLSFSFCQKIRNELTLQIKSYLEQRPIWMKQELLLQKFHIFWYFIKCFSDKDTDPTFDYELAHLVDNKRRRYAFKQHKSKRKNTDRIYLNLDEKERILSKLLNIVSYRFKAGPFRNAVVRFGFDPRDPINKNIARPLQVIDYRINKTDGKKLQIEVSWDGGRTITRGKPMNKSRRNQIDVEALKQDKQSIEDQEERERKEEEKKCKVLMDQMCFRVKPDKLQMYYQMRNIAIKEVECILGNGNKNSYNESCVNSRRTDSATVLGWIKEKDHKRIRELMNEKLAEWVDEVTLKMERKYIEEWNARESIVKSQGTIKMECLAQVENMDLPPDLENPAKRRKIGEGEVSSVNNVESTNSNTNTNSNANLNSNTNASLNEVEVDDDDSELSDDIDLGVIDETMAASFMTNAEDDDVFELL